MADLAADHYELYPYPPRDPRDEGKRLIEGYPSHLAEINHYIFAGRRDFRRPFRALVAGGGTGDGTIMLARQLADRGCPAEIVYVDPSEAARRIAEARAAARKLDNIRFVTGAIEQLPELAPGPFDYIDCCGVLHHLADPEAGLARLVGALADEGGLGLMVYGAIGRTGVYHVQELLRGLAPAESMAPKERLAMAKRLLRNLPPTNWLRRNAAVADHIGLGDAGIHDLLLHRRDRAYSVPEVAALATGAKLDIVAFMEPWRYEPTAYVSDPALVRVLASGGLVERAKAAELIAGNLKTHAFYAVKAGRGVGAAASLEDPDLVPILRGQDAPGLVAGLKPGNDLSVSIDGVRAVFPLPARTRPILMAVDGRRGLAEIHRIVSAADGGRLAWPAFREDFARVYEVFRAINRLLLQLPAG